MLKVYLGWVGTILLCGLVSTVTFHQKQNLRLFSKLGIEHEPVHAHQDEWFNQRLDHFDPTNQGKWLQKYYTNENWFKHSPNSSVFLMIGGEDTINPELIRTAAWVEYARQYIALCFLLEHRFYGDSKPTNDSSVSNLRYLSSEQALADAAYFIEGMNEKYKLTSNNKWIVFGGSYSGSLAAWARLKYPHLIHAAVSTSGPLLAEANFKQYDEVVRESLAASSKQCASNVHQAALMVEQLLEKGDAEDVQTLSKMFDLCELLDIRNPKEVFIFVEYLAGFIQNSVQYNRAYETSKDPFSFPTVADVCMIMDNKSIGTPMDRYAELTHVFNEPRNQGIPCLNVSYSFLIQELKNSSYNNLRSWIYQTCTEFGFYPTSSSKNDLFGSLLQLPFYIDQCRDIFGEDFDSNRLNEGVKRSNMMYGQLDIQVSRVVFVQGSLDPWHVLGISKSTNPLAPVILIEGASHCANMLPPTPQDAPQLVNARKRIAQLLGEWLSAK